MYVLVTEQTMEVPPPPPPPPPAPIGEALAEAGMGTIGYYITHRYNSVPTYISTQPFFEITMAE